MSANNLNSNNLTADNSKLSEEVKNVKSSVQNIIKSILIGGGLSLGLAMAFAVLPVLAGGSDPGLGGAVAVFFLWILCSIISIPILFYFFSRRAGQVTVASTFGKFCMWILGIAGGFVLLVFLVYIVLVLSGH